MSCTLNYVEKALRNVDPVEADRLNKVGVKTWNEIKSSKLFTLDKKSGQYQFEAIGTKIRDKQEDFLNHLNKVGQYVFEKNNDVHVNVLNLYRPQPASETNAVYEKTVNFTELVRENARPVLSSADNEGWQNPNSLLFRGKSIITANEVLANIRDNFTNIDSNSAEVIKRAGNLVSKAKVGVRFVSSDQLQSEDTLMQYDANSNTIMISKERLANRSNKEVAVGFLHEVAHSQTVLAMLKSPKDRTFAEQELVDVVDKFMSKYATSELQKEYGFTNNFEFVAEFYANPEFRQAVKGISDSWWKSLLDAIRRLFDAPANPEFKRLFDVIVDFVEENQLDVEGLKRYDQVFEQRLVDDSKHATLEKTLDNFVKNSQDKIDYVIKKLERSLSFKPSASKQEYLDNIRLLSEELEEHANGQQWRAVTGYVKAFHRSVYQVKKLVEVLKDKKDVEKDDLVNSIDHYKEYLDAFDLLPNIKDLISKASFKKGTFTEAELKDFEEVQQIIKHFESEHASLKKDFLELERAQMIKVFSDPKLNTEIETKHRNAIGQEWVGLTVAQRDGLSKNEYITKMLATRDKQDYEDDLRAAAIKLINDPSVDISKAASLLSDSINTNSRIMQVITNIVTNARLQVLNKFKQRDVFLQKTFDTFIKEKDNGKPSEINKNLVEQGSDGQWYLKGKYKIEFKEKFEKELRPLLQERKKMIQEGLAQGLVEQDVRESPEYVALTAQVAAWYKANTREVKIGTTPEGDDELQTVPDKKYLNTSIQGLSSAEKKMLKSYHDINLENDAYYEGQNSLVTKILNAEFHKLPSIEKSDLERRVEMDAKGYLKDKISDIYQVKADDIEEQAHAVKIDANNRVLRDVKVHYRGEVKPENQSMDLQTMFRKEMFNGLNYQSKKQIKPQLNMIIDIVEGKDYYKTDSAGEKLVNAIAKRNPDIIYKGHLSNEYARILGMVERTLYDTFSENAGGIPGVDVNKLTSFVNGVAASVSMSFNLASGVTNALNGFTQLFIESVGNDKIQRGKVAKAEAKYLKELPNTLKDMTDPVKKSYFNQLLELYDVMGGLDPAEQEAIRNTMMRKFASTKMLNVLNEGGEHMMHSVITEAILDGIKVMNADGNYINKEGQVTSKEEAASLVDMLYMDKNGILKVDDKVIHTDFNMTTKYHAGGHAHVSLLVKKKVFDLFGVYDIKFKNEFSKYWYGKMVMMFKNFFISGAQYRFHGISTSLKEQQDLKDEDKFYNSAEKEYIEGTYSTFVRFMRHGVIPALKELKIAHMKENFDKLTDYEKANLRKATLEIVMTSVVLPSVGLLLAGLGGDGDDDELLWFAIYTNRRLTQELAQFRNPLEMNKMLENPIAGTRFINNALKFAGDVITPINFSPGPNESIFGYLDQNSKGENIMVKDTKKLVPIWTQLDKNYKQLTSLAYGKIAVGK